MKHNYYIYLVGILMFVLYNTNQISASNGDYSKEILENIYPYMHLISNGPYLDAELKPGTPNKKGEYSYYYRCVVITYEVYDLLYAERIGVYDEEGIERKLTKHAFIDVGKVLKIPISDESLYIKSIEWLDGYNIKLLVNNKMYKLNIKNLKYK